MNQLLLVLLGQNLRPILRLRDSDPADVLVQIQNKFQGIPRSQVWEWRLGHLQSDARFDFSTGRSFGRTSWHGKELLKNFVCGESETELR